jgi:hypothetical protein
MISYGAIRGASSGIYATEVTFSGKPSPKVAGDHPRWQFNCPTRAVHPACTLVLPGRTLPDGRGCPGWPIEHSGVIRFAATGHHCAVSGVRTARINAPHILYFLFILALLCQADDLL